MNILLIYTLIFGLIINIVVKNKDNLTLQKSENNTWTAEELSRANTAANINYLNSKEKDMIFYTNLVRMNPVKFQSTYLKNYLEQIITITGPFSQDDLSYISSLNEELKNKKSLPLLFPDSLLSVIARKHALSMGKHGLIGHQGPDNLGVRQRIHTLGFLTCSIGENCQYGHDRGDYIICDLLVDYGIENLGHRRLLFNDKFEFVGVSIAPHSKYRYNSVMDFAGSCI